MSKTSVLVQQFLPVRGIVNARDLGGYKTADGRRVRAGRLIRSAHLAEATGSDLRYLAGLPVTTVIDFRKEEEKVGKVNKTVEGSQYICLPIDASGNAAASATEEEKKKFTGRKKFDVKKIIVMAAFNDKAKAVARSMYPILLSALSVKVSSRSSSALSFEPRAGQSYITAPRVRTVPE